MQNDKRTYDEVESTWFAMLSKATGKTYPGVYDPKRPLPDFVARAGATAKREWAPLRPRIDKNDKSPIREFGPGVDSIRKVEAELVAQKAAKRAEAIAAGVPVLQGSGRTGTDAEVVRDYIRAAIAGKQTIEFVIAQVMAAPLSFPESKAKRYVTGNWARVVQQG